MTAIVCRLRGYHSGFAEIQPLCVVGGKVTDNYKDRTLLTFFDFMLLKKETSFSIETLATTQPSNT
jgi:hypothetical protein